MTEIPAPTLDTRSCGAIDWICHDRNTGTLVPTHAMAVRLSQISTEQMLRQPNIGPITLARIAVWMAHFGLTFSDKRPPEPYPTLAARAVETGCLLAIGVEPRRTIYLRLAKIAGFEAIEAHGPTRVLFDAGGSIDVCGSAEQWLLAAGLVQTNPAAPHPFPFIDA